ncbi:mediator of RNA polymerase II transcription subunit 23-like isoform X2 [Artemia franciscana]|uniref:mediator of RNA polymerase II transcription subunit 23-like isoform X2 n=1 Tax=Artemia franciscana TaxID=6661 RepID=UPI0032DA24F1
MTTENEVSNLVSDLTKINTVEEGFSPFLILNQEEDTARWESLQSDLGAAIQRNPPEFVDLGLKQLAHGISTQVVHTRARKLFLLLEELIKLGIVPARKVFDILLANEKLSPHNEFYWNGTFRLIYKIISDVDYKGVREIMKVCLEKARLLPNAYDLGLHLQVAALQKVMEKICDRKECLLPAYFVVNEIEKMYPENKNWPNWVCLEKAHLLPNAYDPALHLQVAALKKVMEKVCNRKERFLPAYFVVNEIEKMYPENKNWPHWNPLAQEMFKSLM